MPGVPPLPILAVGGIVLALLLGAQLMGLASWLHMDDLAYDTLVRLRADAAPSNQVVIADIDEISLTTVGQWPWPRYRLARLLQTIAAAGPRTIAMDILFAEPDRTSLKALRDAFRREFGLDLGFTGIPSGLDDNDGYFAEMVGRTHTVGALYFYASLYNQGNDCVLPALEITGKRELLRPFEASGMLCNIPGIQRRLAGSGFVNAAPDSDGMLRRLPLLAWHGGQWQPSLALAILLHHQQQYRVHIETDFWGPVLHVGSLRIPVDSEGNVLLRFRNPTTATPRISALELLRDAVPSETLAGKVVILGSTAAGLNDFHATPVAREMPGAATFAVLIDNALGHDFYRQPAWHTIYGHLTSLVAGLLILAAFVRTAPLRAMGMAAGMATGFVGLSLALFWLAGVHLPFAGPLTCIGVLCVVLSILVFRSEEKLVFEQLDKLAKVKQLTLESMAAVAENRHIEADGHIKRTQHYVRLLAEQLRDIHYSPLLTQAYIELLYHSAPLHDVGKVAIPDSILFKQGPLNEAEFKIMQQHAMFGKRIIEAASSRLEGDNFLQLAAEIAVSHHERWDGSGYPHGLAAHAIPLSGRIMALADVYDALISQRVYKPMYSHATAREIIVSHRGSHFDPVVVDCFLACEEAFQRTARRFQDASSLPPGQEGAVFRVIPRVTSRS